MFPEEGRRGSEVWGPWASDRPWDLEGKAEDVMKLSLERLRCVGWGPGSTGAQTAWPRSLSRNGWWVWTRSEAGATKAGSQGLNFSPTEIQAELPGEPAGAWLGQRVLFTIAQTGTNPCVPGRTDPQAVARPRGRSS